MKYLLLAGIGAMALACAPAQARPFTPADMVGLNRIGAPAVSPDGKWLAYQLRSTDLAANRGRTDLYLLAIDGPDRTPRKIASLADKNEGSPVFSPDGSALYFQSDASGDDQLWRVALSGGDPVQISRAPGGISGFLLSPARRHRQRPGL